MTALADIQAAMVATIKDKLPKLKTCEAHEGRFDAGELKRVAGRCPAVYIACLGVGQPVNEGSTFAPLRWGAFIVTKDAPRSDRNSQALNLVQAINVILAAQEWGLNETRSEPERVTSQNLFSNSTADKGVSMWAVTWTQEFQLDNGLDWDSLNDFLTAVSDSTASTGATINTHQALPGASS